MTVNSIATPAISFNPLFSSPLVIATSYPSIAPTIVEPDNSLDMRVRKGNFGVFSVIGVGSDNQTGQLRIVGWRSLASRQIDPDKIVWFPTVLALVDFTLSANTGFADSAFGTTSRAADTMADATSPSADSIKIISPADDATLAMVIVDALGCELLTANVLSSSFTRGNVLASVY